MPLSLRTYLHCCYSHLAPYYHLKDIFLMVQNDSSASDECLPRLYWKGVSKCTSIQEENQVACTSWGDLMKCPAQKEEHKATKLKTVTSTHPPLHSLDLPYAQCRCIILDLCLTTGNTQMTDISNAATVLCFSALPYKVENSDHTSVVGLIWSKTCSVQNVFKQETRT